MVIEPREKKITSSRVHVITRIPSEKNGKRIATMSRNERNVGWKLEFLSSVMSYESQPFACYFEMDGKIRKYTPDFCVYFHDDATPLVLEVKPAKFFEDRDLQRKLRIVARELPEEGYRFMTLTEKEIPSYAEYTNLRFLFNHRRRLPNEEVIEEVVALVRKGFTRCYCLDDYIRRKDNSQASVYSLISNGVLTSDLATTIDFRTHVSLVEGDR